MSAQYWTRLAAISAATAVILTGCSPQGPTTGTTSSVDLNDVDYSGTITMVNKFSDPSTAKYFPAMAAEFEKLHPDVKIEIDQQSDQGYKDKIKVLASSNSLPDLYFTWAGETAKQYIDAGLALDITSQIGPGTEWNKSLVSSAVNAGEFGGKNYGIPLDLDAKFMVYNKKMFADNGIRIPTSMQELLSACDSLDGDGITPINFGNKFAWPAILYLTQLNAYTVPEDIRLKDYSAKQAEAGGAFTNPGYAEALTQLKQLLDKCTRNGKTANGIDHTEQLVDFAAGNAAMMYIEWVEFGLLKDTQVDKDGWGIFQLPAASGSAGSPSTIAGSPDLFLVNSQAKNPALAVAFMKFVVSSDGAAKMPELMIGYPSPIAGSINAGNATPQSVAALDAVDKAAGFAIWLDQATRPVVSSAYLAGGEALLSGTSSADDVMKSVQQAAASSGNS